jgi:hypothetical protein
MIDGDSQRRNVVCDLSPLVTVYVTTVGAPSFARCMEHLQAQDCTFNLQVIDHVAPMQAAFQLMLDRCRTPYYVQVDEDMILLPHAVRTLYECIEAAGSTVAVYAGDLFDEHLQRCIIGVKIFRHAVVQRYPLVDVDGFEIHQVARLEADGFKIIRTTAGETPIEGETLGFHGTAWTAESIYERYANLMRRRRTHEPPQLLWLDVFPQRFLDRFLRDPSEQNFFALMGIVAGVLGTHHGKGDSKDFRAYARLPGFQALRAFLQDCEQWSPERIAAAVASAEGQEQGQGEEEIDPLPSEPEP